MPSSFSVFQLQMSSKRRDYLYRLRNSIFFSDKTIRDGNNNKLSSFFLLELLIYDHYIEAIKNKTKDVGLTATYGTPAAAVAITNGAPFH